MLRKIDAMYHYYGRDHANRKCEECEHLIHGNYHDKGYYKCTVYGCSHSEATDWRKSYHACGLIDKPFPAEDNLSCFKMSITRLSSAGKGLSISPQA